MGLSLTWVSSLLLLVTVSAILNVCLTAEAAGAGASGAGLNSLGNSPTLRHESVFE